MVYVCLTFCVAVSLVAAGTKSSESEKTQIPALFLYIHFLILGNDELYHEPNAI